MFFPKVPLTRIEHNIFGHPRRKCHLIISRPFCGVTDSKWRETAIQSGSLGANSRQNRQARQIDWFLASTRDLPNRCYLRFIHSYEIGPFRIFTRGNSIRRTRINKKGEKARYFTSYTIINERGFIIIVPTLVPTINLV